MLQKELDEFREDWNNHRIRKSTMAETLGGIPEFLYFAPTHCGQKFRCYEAKIEESEKAGSRRESNPGHLACAASALPLSYDNRTTTSPHNPLYVLHRWD